MREFGFGGLKKTLYFLFFKIFRFQIQKYLFISDCYIITMAKPQFKPGDKVFDTRDIGLPRVLVVELPISVTKTDSWGRTVIVGK